MLYDNIAVDYVSPQSFRAVVSYTTFHDNHANTVFEEFETYDAAKARAAELAAKAEEVYYF